MAGPGVGAMPAGQAGPGTLASAASGQRGGATSSGQGQVQPPHALRSVMPPFMFRGSQIPPGNHPAGNHPAGNLTAGNHPAGYQGHQNPRGPFVAGSKFPPLTQEGGRYRQGPRVANPTNQGDATEVYPRPIIKEEDLRRMDEISGDDGWAAIQDEPDYDKKLFSDEVTEEVKDRHVNEIEEEVKTDRDGKWADNIQAEGRALATPPALNTLAASGRPPFSQATIPRQHDSRSLPNNRGLSLDEDEFWREQQQQQKNEEMKAALRAKERRY